MIKIEDTRLCCGCSACASICSRSAITISADAEGFLYPQINMVSCIDCGACNEVCAFSKRKNAQNSDVSAFAVIHNSKDVLSESTSGGVFTAVSDLILAEGGSVYGAVFDSEFTVKHSRAVTADERNKMRGSKYVQSDVCGIFVQVKSDLNSGKKVLFTGTPCQVDALRSYLHKDYDNLFCCDLVCHGTPSPLVWKAYIDLLSHKMKSRLVEYKFRPKRWGWHSHNVISTFSNGKELHSNGWSNLFKNMYYGAIIMRPSCHNCPYTNLNRVGDLTIADCQGVESVLPDINSVDGVSLVLINTEKGERIFGGISNVVSSYPVDVKKVMQPPLVKPCALSPSRITFWNEFNRAGLLSAVKKTYGQSYFIKQRIKGLLMK